MHFHVWEDAIVWAHGYASQLSGTSILCFHILSSSALTLRSVFSLVAARWQVFFPSRVPSGLTSSPSVMAAEGGVAHPH